MSSKTHAQMVHSRRRAAQRLGVGVPSSRLKQLAQMIRSGDAVFIEKKTNRIKIWEVDGIRVAYDKTRGTIASVLPSPHFEKGASQ